MLFNLKKWLGIVLILCAIFSLSACVPVPVDIDDDPDKEPYSSNTTVDASSDITSTDDTAKIFGLNETAVFKNYKITAVEIKETTGKEYFEPKDGYIFVGVKFVVENISNEQQTISSYDFSAYSNDFACDDSMSASIAFDSQYVSGTLAAGKKLSGWYSVEIPKDWDNLEIVVKPELFSDTTASFVFNK